jgi:aspartyl-tRNA(Asn)/glutamyl-tRNA(Gln) amidotransferase subunit A
MSAALHDLGVAGLAARWRGKQVSSVEVTQHLLGRIAAQQRAGRLPAVDAEAPLAAAQAADARRAAGDAAPLLGVPMAHKDIFVTRALPTTAGSKMLAGYASPFDATVVARLAEAGAVSWAS